MGKFKVGISPEKILGWMSANGWRVLARNIVYLEGADYNSGVFSLTEDVLDCWDDLRLIITDKGQVIHAATATTEPGSYYTYNRMNPLGVARIAFGNYVNCWEVGIHGVSFPHEALVQCGDITVYRDDNEDGSRVGDATDTGIFAVNQHSTSNAPETIGAWSAGCLTGKYYSSHQKFMQINKDSGRTKFDTTVIAADKLWDWLG